jgi:peptide methionine sulfoxide reductase msrA/msrB
MGLTLLFTSSCASRSKTQSEPQPVAEAASNKPAGATGKTAKESTTMPNDKPASDPAAARGEVAVLAGGCFWGMEEILRGVPGVIETEVGYAGGITPNPTYQDVTTGESGHAESVRIVFDPQKLSYAELLEKWFFRMHDPTTKNRQGNDYGTQYRSAIFVSSSEQRKVAEAVKRKVAESGKWKSPIVTEIVEAGPFTPAESYHQDYLQKNPRGYTCHYLRD